MSDISDFLGIGSGEGEVSKKDIFEMATGQWLVNALLGTGGAQGGEGDESFPRRSLESYSTGERGWRSDQPGGGGTVAAPTGGVSQPSDGGGGGVFSQLLGALTDKDSEGPTSFSVTPSKVGGYSYKIDGQAPQEGLPKEESKMGTSEDFMKMFGG